MLIKVTCHLRSIIAFLSENNLKDYLRKAVAVLPSDSELKPIVVKEILDRRNLKKEEVKETLGKLKNIVKEYNLPNRKPFQVTIIDPIQFFMDERSVFVPKEMFETIRNQKEILRKTEKELSESQKTVKDVSTIPFPKVLSSN